MRTKYRHGKKKIKKSNFHDSNYNHMDPKLKRHGPKTCINQDISRENIKFDNSPKNYRTVRYTIVAQI